MWYTAADLHHLVTAEIVRVGVIPMLYPEGGDVVMPGVMHATQVAAVRVEAVALRRLYAEAEVVAEGGAGLARRPGLYYLRLVYLF